MNIEHNIVEGDTVKVDFHNSQTTLSHEALVIRKPQATGDSWVFQDKNLDTVWWVSEGCTITKLS